MNSRLESPSDRRLRLAVCLRGISFAEGVGGMERAAAQHLRLMVDAGMPVTLFAPRKFVVGEPPSGVGLVDVEWPRWNRGTGSLLFGLAYRIWVGRLAHALRGVLGSDLVVHLHGGSAAAIPSLLRQDSTPVRTVVNPHGMEEFGKATLSRLPNRLILRRMSRHARNADAVIATDESLVPQVVSNIGVDRERVVVIANAVDADALVRASSPIREGGAPFTVVSIGRLVSNKGYDLLAEALALPEVARRLPSDWRWLHFGSGHMRKMLLARSAEILDGRLEIRAGRPDDEVQSALASATIFAQPSRYEGSSLTTLEAMAHGSRIVATPVGGIPDKIRDGVTGHLAREVSPEGIAQALIRAIEAPDEIGACARKLVNERFSEQRMAAEYVDLYVRGKRRIAN